MRGLRGGLGEHVVSEGRSDAVAVGVHGVVPVHVHVHVNGVQRDVTRVHGAVAGVQFCREGTRQPQLLLVRILQPSATLLVPPFGAACGTWCCKGHKGHPPPACPKALGQPRCAGERLDALPGERSIPPSIPGQPGRALCWQPPKKGFKTSLVR